MNYKKVVKRNIIFIFSNLPLMLSKQYNADEITNMNNIKKKLNDLPAEQMYGNREYKWKLLGIEELKYEKLATQMKYRLNEGKGKALYLLGVRDNGTAIGISSIDLNETINVILKAGDIINANIKIIRIYRGSQGLIATIRITWVKLSSN